MAEPSPILPVSPVAAVNNGTDIRVYILSTTGGVREVASFYGGSWTGGYGEIGRVKLMSPLAATSMVATISKADKTTITIFDDIRVYGLDAANRISEFAYNNSKGWHTGGLTGRFQVAPVSQLAAIFVNKGGWLRVYAQLPDNTIQEFGSNDKTNWFLGDNFGQGLPGTPIAALSVTGPDDQRSIRVYFQDRDGNIAERAWDVKFSRDKWSSGVLPLPGPLPRTTLSAVRWFDAKGVVSLRVYYGTADGRIKEKEYENSSTGWRDGVFSQATVTGSRSAVVAIKARDLRIFAQTGTCVSGFVEFKTTGGSEVWGVGQNPMPPF